MIDKKEDKYLLRNKNFILLLISQNLSAFGDWFRTIAAIGLIYKVTGSAANLSLLFISSMLPMILVSTLCSPLIDKYSRKTIMMISDFCRLIIGLSFVFIVVNDLNINYMYLLLAINGVCTGFYFPARSTIIPELVNINHLTRANSILATSFSTSMLIATGLGGVIGEVLAVEYIFLLDAITFLLSGILIVFIKTVKKSSSNQNQPSQSYFQSITEGFKIIRSKPIIQSSIWILTSREFAISIVNIIFSLYILSVVQAGNLGLGLAYLASGLGQIIGGITLAKYFKNKQLSIKFYKTWSSISLILLGILHSLSYQQPYFIVFLILVVIANIWYSPIEVLYTTSIMTNVSEELRGRVFASAISLSRTAHILGFILVGIIGDILPVSTIAMGIGIFLITAGILNRVLLLRQKEHITQTSSLNS
ncbi:MULTISPECIES: MFS transporter [Cytobacillus]|uniref:MFS transporter n=1 Tax=Cytobacillus kochii TaxID=859143 RepID=A0A248TPR2_9BACI|nr:MFS transporter [Cytobacillus kochii]ASV70186.1 MFS transporter [Cytobacillus kochii]MDQ0186621.1 MFS family permease [Cytobacillus kochii]